MMIKKTITLVLLMVALMSYAQQKKVAVVTFFADKSIDLSQISPTADLVLKNTKLAEDPNFNLGKILKTFHNEFFNSYVKNFPFEVIKESDVLANEAYKSFKADYSQLMISHVEDLYEVIDGYKLIRPYKLVVDQTNAKLAKELGADGVMFVRISFDFNKTGIGKFGYISVRAKARIDLYDKNGKSIFQFSEIAGSKKKAPMVGGVPVMTPEKIFPMCESAVEKLMKDMNKKLARLSKKTKKKFK